jgi:hypothetical protein
VFFSLSNRLADDATGLGAMAHTVLADVAFARIRAVVESSSDCR